MVRPIKYPWHEWFDGVPTIITRGIDFDVPTENMVHAIHGKARVFGIKAKTRRLNDNKIWFVCPYYKEVT